MKRLRFKLAPDAASRVVDCAHYRFNGGAPACDALTHPWCLAVGSAPAACRFRIPTEAVKGVDDEDRAHGEKT